MKKGNGSLGIIMVALFTSLLYAAGIIQLHQHTREMQHNIRLAEQNNQLLREWEGAWDAVLLSGSTGVLQIKKPAPAAAIQSAKQAVAQLQALGESSGMPYQALKAIAELKSQSTHFGNNIHSPQLTAMLRLPAGSAQQQAQWQQSLRTILPLGNAMLEKGRLLMTVQATWLVDLRSGLDRLLDIRLVLSIAGFCLGMMAMAVFFYRAMQFKQQQHHAESALATTAERYKNVAEESGLITAFLSVQGQISYLSAPIQSITGFAPKELIGKNWTDLLASDSRDMAAQFSADPQRWNHTQKLELKVLCKFGGERWLSAQLFPIRDENGYIKEMHAVLWDIHEEKLSRQLLEKVQQEKASEQKLVQSLLDNVPAAVFVKDLNDRYIMANKYLADLHQCNQSDLIGKSAAAIQQGKVETTLSNCDQEVINTLQPSTCESWFNVSDNERRYLMVTKYPLFDQAGQLAYIAGIATDMTASKQNTILLEQTRREAEEARHSQELFLANISHEIRTPLNGVLGMTYVLKQQQLNEEQQNYVETIHECGLILVALINDLLDFAKIRSGRFVLDEAPFQPAASLHKALRPFLVQAREKGIALNWQVNENVPEWLLGDSLRLEQVVINLVSNALKFTKQGAVAVNFNALPGGNSEILLQIKVADTGIGIPADRQDKIFDAFVQSSPSSQRQFGGTGLGLAIIKQLTEMQGGSIQLESQLNRGSVFTITIPFKLAEPDCNIDKPEEAFADTHLLHGVSVLLVEDFPVNQMVAKMLLQQQGATVTIAENGKQAISELQNGQFDIVLMDLQMPEMGGLEATHFIREQLQSAIPIVAMTADAMQDEVNKCLSAGMQGFICKPFDPAHLYLEINKQLGRAGIPEQVMPSLAESSAELPQEQEQVLIDLSILETIANGDEEYISTVIDVFLSTIPVNLTTLQTAYEAKDNTALASIAHKLKSALGIIRIGNTLTQLQELEEEMRKGIWQQQLADNMVPQLIHTLQKGVRLLQQDKAQLSTTESINA